MPVAFNREATPFQNPHSRFLLTSHGPDQCHMAPAAGSLGKKRCGFSISVVGADRMELGWVLSISAQCPPYQMSDRVLGLLSPNSLSRPGCVLCPSKMGTELPEWTRVGWRLGSCLGGLEGGRLGRESPSYRLTLYWKSGHIQCARLCSVLHECPCEQRREREFKC